MRVWDIFEFTIYNGYTSNALKGYKGETMPSIGITDTYRCPVHGRLEHLVFIDIDSKEKYPELKDIRYPYIITESKYGYHIILVPHTTRKREMIRIMKEVTDQLTQRGYDVDIHHQKIGLQRGRVILRIFGKYADEPLVKVREYRGDDEVINSLLKLYRIAERIIQWEDLTESQYHMNL